MLMSSTDRHPFSDCLTHRVCREAGTNRSKSKIALRLFSNGIRGWDRSIKVFVEKVSSLLNVKDKRRRLRDLNQRKGHSSRWWSRSQRGQSSWFFFFWGGGQSSRCLLGAPRERWERRVSGVPSDSRQLWHTYVSGTWLLRILAHDRWIQVWHLLHSIMARPAKGFLQKHVTRSHESSSDKTGESMFSLVTLSNL